jgi:hypothetical protein
MMDIWNKFQSKATTKSVYYRSETAMPLPCFTLHHQQSFKEHGKVAIHDRRADALLVWFHKTLTIHLPIWFENNNKKLIYLVLQFSSLYEECSIPECH